VNEVSFRAFPMNHVRGKLECFGYRVPVGGKTVAYTGDTMFCEEIFELAAGADVLVLDCT
jgi:ribonuclease Z